MKNHKYLKNNVLSMILLGICLTIAYWPSFFNGFISWDDNIYVFENEMIRQLSWDSISKIFTTDVSLNYTPLTILTFALEYRFWGYDPFVYHFNNLVLHIFVVVLLYRLVFEISESRKVAFISAIIFGLHPMHVESVAWITERKDVLYASFYLLALNFYWIYLRENKIRWFVLTLAAGFLSILSKPMALSLPFVLLIFDWFYQRRIDFKVLFEKGICAVSLAPIAWLTYLMNSREILHKFPESLLTWVWTFVFYIRKFFVPQNFLPLYELPQPVKITNPEFLVSLAGFLIFILLLIRFRANRWFVFAFLYYFASIFFILRFDAAVDLCIVADRFMYLPSLGFCVLIGIGLEKMRQKFKTAVDVCLAFLIVFLAFSTYQQTKIWGDEASFWTRVIKTYPRSMMAYNQRALSYKANGKLKEALEDYTMAVTLFPLYDYAYTNRGIVYKEMGLLKEAYDDHTRAIEINPGFSEAYLNRGNVLFSAGDFEGAVMDYDKAIVNLNASARRNYTPYRAETYSRRGSGYFFMKKYDEALKDFNIALEINPDNLVALDNRAVIFSIRGENEKALKDYNRSLKIAPDNPVTYRNLQRLYKKMKETQ